MANTWLRYENETKAESESIVMENTFILNMNKLKCPYTSGIHSKLGSHEFYE